MSAAAAVNYIRGDDGVGWITFDAPGSRANVFNPDTLSALAAALDAAARDRPKAVVVTSAKDKIFVAGADLNWLAALETAEEAEARSRQGQTLFQRMTEMAVPVVCAIHGACAGGGFELALACHWRIATDAPPTQIGLPETSLGTIPGWGGCVRLPRLIGAEPALQHILKAQLIPAREALAAGMINEIAPAAELRARAQATALSLAAEGVAAFPPRPAPTPNLFARLRADIVAKTRGQQPAPLAAVDAVEQTIGLPIPDALKIEARIFGPVTAGPVCKNLIRAFYLRDAAKKRSLDGWFEPKARGSSANGGSRGETSLAAQPAGAGSKSARDVALPRCVGVVGAGVMGSGIAQWLAARGFDVVLRDVQPELVERGLGVIRGLFDEAVKRGKLDREAAQGGLSRIGTTTAWDDFERCDLVIEAIIEDVAAKQKLFAELSDVARADAVLASNSSALPIEEIARDVSRPERTLGIHFFNPVSRMPLVELVIGRHTSAEAAAVALGFVKALGKSPVLCRSSPGFLVTRVLFFYLNEAVRLWEQGLSTTAIDAALRDYGWPMGPLRLIDEVGIDVTDFIFGEMAHYFPPRITRATATARLLAAGLRGRKNGTGTGFYTYAGTEQPNDIRTRGIAGRLGELTLPPEEISARLMRVMTSEAERCLAEGVVKSADDIDFALLTGTGYPAWRGSLLPGAR